jgi:hypothetical protein
MTIMATMGKYCKAYSLKKLREFSGWSEKTENARKERKETGGTEVEVQADCPSPRDLTDDDFLYLQENYVVTDGIFKDENVIFDDTTSEWVEYCQRVLGFEIPEYARAEVTE